MLVCVACKDKAGLLAVWLLVLAGFEPRVGLSITARGTGYPSAGQFPPVKPKSRGC